MHSVSLDVETYIKMQIRFTPDHDELRCCRLVNSRIFFLMGAALQLNRCLKINKDIYVNVSC
jgi:hypothetical protein